MSDGQGDDEMQPVGDDTAAFQRFYRGPEGESRGLLYRLFVGWWRDKSR